MAVDPLDPNPMLRAEWQAALDVINPQIRGLLHFARNALTAPTANAIAVQIAMRQRRASLLSDGIASLDSVIVRRGDLANDGYPGIQEIPATAEVSAEIQDLENDLVIAASVLGATIAAHEQAAIDAADAAIKANTAALGGTMKPANTAAATK